MTKGKFISCFSCTGKTHFVLNNWHKIDCVDHDMYDFEFRGKLGEKWLSNYLNRMYNLKTKFDFVFVNAVPEIIVSLPEDSIVIYPNSSLKLEWWRRALNRNTGSKFPQILHDNFDKWITACENWQGRKLELLEGEYLTDYEDYLIDFLGEK